MNKIKANRTKNLSVKISCVCVSKEYFDSHFRDYYDFLTYNTYKSKLHGYYGKTFYRIKSISDFVSYGLDIKRYSDLPRFICVSEIY